ncbi:hypothetical protein P7K49_032541 [Saguinus oedipus]|uniref:Uncharacterized protein n=1 Tax=Saguinus oedipus TaxID=9490 RepID=A0ABQ9TZH1_SAGOE|nr:hypothetical protein P7K49_032541 [Saguinus oedipus]
METEASGTLSPTRPLCFSQGQRDKRIEKCGHGLWATVQTRSSAPRPALQPSSAAGRQKGGRTHEQEKTRTKKDNWALGQDSSESSGCAVTYIPCTMPATQPPVADGLIKMLPQA